MQSVADVSRLIDRIYAAGETGDGWSQCLGGVCEALDGTGGHLFHYDLSARAGMVVVDARTDPAAIEAYQAHYHRVDPWATSLATGGLPVGQVIPGQAVVPHAAMQRTEYYADLGRAFGLTRALFGFTRQHADGSRSVISINRADTQPEFDDEAVAFLSALMPHLGRSWQMQARWSAVGQRHQAALDALDALPYGVMLVDGRARVCFANTRASALLAARDGIATDDHRLRGADATSTRRLREVCAEVARTRAGVPRSSGATLRLPRASGAAPLEALVAPVQARGPLAVSGHDVAAIVYLSDPAETALPDEAILAGSLGLTASEARVARLLGTGSTADEIADELAYTRETVRWYIKQVLAKSGCRSRTAFAAHAARSIAMIRTR